MPEALPDVDGIRAVIRQAFCGEEDRSYGFRHAIDGVSSHLLSYVAAVDPENIEAPDLIGDIEKDARLREGEILLRECNDGIRDQLKLPNSMAPEVDSGRGDDKTLANLLMVPEQLEAVQFFLKRLEKAIGNLIAELANVRESKERKARGISEFAQVEIREICQRLNTITVFTVSLIRESPSGFPGQGHVERLSEQLGEFVKIAMARHQDRLLRGACTLGHHSPYCVILDATRLLGERVAQIAAHWSA